MRLGLSTLLAAGLCAGAAPAEEFRVTMAGASYSPEALTASTGDTIRLINDDAIDHNVFIPTAGHALDAGKQEPGREVVLTLAKPGRFTVECVFHPGMDMTVEVN